MIALREPTLLNRDMRPSAVLDNGSHGTALGRLLEQGSRAGYRLRLRATSMGLELPEPDTPVEPFVVNEDSILAKSPESPIWAWLRGPNRVYEGDDGEFYLQDPAGRSVSCLDERLVEELLKERLMRLASCDGAVRAARASGKTVGQGTPCSSSKRRVRGREERDPGIWVEREARTLP